MNNLYERILNCTLLGNDPAAVYVDAVDARNGEHRNIMYSSAKVIGSGSFGMVFAALLDGQHEVPSRKCCRIRDIR